jgi:D-alanyl-lipoteichoic acid acyltransferase DltB (MBOAT superfamily)
MPAGIAFNLALLAFFSTSSCSSTPRILPAPRRSTSAAAAAAIGISFFVFHNISLLVDLTREEPAAAEGRLSLHHLFAAGLRPITAPRSSCCRSPKRAADVDFVEAAK